MPLKVSTHNLYIYTTIFTYEYRESTLAHAGAHRMKTRQRERGGGRDRERDKERRITVSPILVVANGKE